MAMVNRENEKSLQQMDNNTLFVGNIPKNKTKENLFFEISKISGKNLP